MNSASIRNRAKSEIPGLSGRSPQAVQIALSPRFRDFQCYSQFALYLSKSHQVRECETFSVSLYQPIDKTARHFRVAAASCCDLLRLSLRWSFFFCPFPKFSITTGRIEIRKTFSVSPTPFHCKPKRGDENFSCRFRRKLAYIWQTSRTTSF